MYLIKKVLPLVLTFGYIERQHVQLMYSKMFLFHYIIAKKILFFNVSVVKVEIKNKIKQI